MYFCTSRKKEINTFVVEAQKRVLGIFKRNVIPTHSNFCDDMDDANTYSYKLLQGMLKK